MATFTNFRGTPRWTLGISLTFPPEEKKLADPQSHEDGELHKCVHGSAKVTKGPHWTSLTGRGTENPEKGSGQV